MLTKPPFVLTDEPYWNPRRCRKRRRWTAEENRCVLDQEEDNDEILAGKINRTVFAIRKQRERLKTKGETSRHMEPWEAKLIDGHCGKEHEMVAKESVSGGVARRRVRKQPR